MSVYTFIDMFSGAGGFTEGLLLSGSKDSAFKLVCASDIHMHAGMTHENRFKNQMGLEYEFVVGDIRLASVKKSVKSSISKVTNRDDVDVVVGGPPCQGFALFGARNENDPRNDLFKHYLSVINSVSPKYFVMENVPGLKMMYSGKTVNMIKKAVEALKNPSYKLIGPIDVNASNYGVPQLRDRILFIGCREDMVEIKDIPFIPQKKVSVREAIDDLSFLKPWEESNAYREDYQATTQYQEESRSGRLFKRLGIEYEPLQLLNHQAAKHTPDVMARFSLIEQGKGLDSIPREVWDRHLSSSKKWCVKLHPDVPSYTMVTLPDDFVHYKWPRVLTVREVARIQSFDDSFVFLGPRSTGGGGVGNKKRSVELPQYSQVGNAVPPLMAKAVGNVLLKHLENSS